MRSYWGSSLLLHCLANENGNEGSSNVGLVD